MGPHQFVGIELGRVWRQEEQLQSVSVVLDEGSHQFGLVRGVSVDHKEHLALHAGDQPLQELAKYLGVDPTRPLIVTKRDWPCAETAESMLNPYRALVALITGVLPAGAQVVPA